VTTTCRSAIYRIVSKPLQKLSPTPQPDFVKARSPEFQLTSTPLPQSSMPLKSLKSPEPPLIPLLEPPESASIRPPLDRIRPSLSRTNPFADLSGTPPSGWKVQTHVFPAAFPRSQVGSAKFEGAPPSVIVNGSANGDFSHHNLKPLIDEMLDRLVRAPPVDVARREMYSDDKPLWIAVNRYYFSQTRRDRRRGLTLVLAPATGT
jgi:hypothetical protein